MIMDPSPLYGLILSAFFAGVAGNLTYEIYGRTWQGIILGVFVAAMVARIVTEIWFKDDNKKGEK